VLHLIPRGFRFEIPPALNRPQGVFFPKGGCANLHCWGGFNWGGWGVGAGGGGNRGPPKIPFFARGILGGGGGGGGGPKNKKQKKKGNGGWGAAPNPPPTATLTGFRTISS